MEPALLDRFIPAPDVRAPAALVMEVAAGFDMQSLPAVKAIFRLREVLLGASPHEMRRPQGVVEETRRLGWGQLVNEPGHDLVCGARCQPWLANVHFTAIEPERFAHLSEQDQVKFAWTLEAEEITPKVTRLAQETRAVATDAQARAKFRRYWLWARFGIAGIRLLLMAMARMEAERRGGPPRARRWTMAQAAPDSLGGTSGGP